MKNPIELFLSKQGALILDGGLATELEARGHDLSDALWSARLLHEAPQAIKRVHLDYLAAGADCIISASYQATVPGFVQRDFDERQAEQLLQRAVKLATEARDEFWAQPANRSNRLRPLVAASVGPFGAYLADGSEYRGDYGLSEAELLAFHRSRWHLLASCAPDLLACETIPSGPEARALARLAAETPDMPVWISFSCRDGRRLHDGTRLAEMAALLDAAPQIVAIGINCTAPRFITQLIREVRAQTGKSVVVYPNSGERYDAATGTWRGLSIPKDFARQSCDWRAAGATLVGGCCRTGPQHITQIRDAQLNTM